MVKADFKRQKELYQPTAKQVSLVDVPPMKFIMVDGRGDPNNNPNFEYGVEALYTLSYGLKMLPKKGQTPVGYFEYTVGPLEGLWWISGGQFNFEERDTWVWTLMIRQPDFVTPELFSGVQQAAMVKKDNPALAQARLEDYHEGLAVQIMHLGPYSDEPATVAKLEAFIQQGGYHFSGKHHEIYLSDPRKGDPAKLKTVLRHPVQLSRT